MHTSRRKFLKYASLATAGISIVPGMAVSGLGHRAPGDKLNIDGWSLPASLPKPLFYDLINAQNKHPK